MIILVDIGGTHTRVAKSDGMTFSTPVAFDTEQSYEQGIQTLITQIRNVLAGDTISQIVIGIAGTLAPDTRELVRAPHLLEWCRQDIAGALTHAFQVPVHLENDSALGALGEAVVGAGKDAGIVAYVTVGTGVGGARIVHGAIDDSAYGFEIGHQYLFVGNEPKELEELVSGSGLRTRYGKSAEDITDENVWDECAKYLAYGIFNTIVHWSPHLVVVGGSIFTTTAVDLPTKVTEHLQKIGSAFPLPPLVHGTLGDSCGLYGALVRASQV